jgi:hypothetical protein
MKDQNNWEVIDVYSRAEAIADGFQVLCPDAIRQEAGIKFPVYFTRTLWDQYITPPKNLEGYGQSLDGRLWDVLYMWHFNVKAQRPDGPEMVYKVIFTMPRSSSPLAKGDKGGLVSAIQKTITIYSVIGPADFDNPAPAITIMLPGED